MPRLFLTLVTLLSLSRGLAAESPNTSAAESKAPGGLAIVIVSAMVGGVVSYLGALLKNALGTRARIDESLRGRRLEVYAELWARTELLPKWPKATDITYTRVATFSMELKTWYFQKGGLFLSEEAREAYGNLQEGLCTLPAGNADQPLLDDHYKTARELCSALRTELTRDLLSRRRTFLVAE